MSSGISPIWVRYMRTGSSIFSGITPRTAAAADTVRGGCAGSERSRSIGKPDRIRGGLFDDVDAVVF